MSEGLRHEEDPLLRAFMLLRKKVNYHPYYGSAEDIMLSKDKALCELKDHGVVDLKKFFDDLGDREEYHAQSLLIWLGY